MGTKHLLSDALGTSVGVETKATGADQLLSHTASKRFSVGARVYTSGSPSSRNVFSRGNASRTRPGRKAPQQNNIGAAIERDRMATYQAQLQHVSRLSRERAHANMGLVVNDLKNAVASRGARDYVEQVAAISTPPNYRSYLGSEFGGAKS